MTEPTTNQVTTGVKALVDNSKRLGLTWQLRLGTIRTTGPSPTLILDGDDVTTLNAVSMAGNMGVGARVYVLLVPPDGVYIVGQVAWFESGSVSITFAAATSFSQGVTFDRRFVNSPRVFLNIASASGNTSFWSAKAFSITESGFTLNLLKQSGLAANAWTGHAVQWYAVAP